MLVDVGCLCLLPDSSLNNNFEMTELELLIQDRISLLKEYLVSLCFGSGNAPAAICLARSDSDGYTPSSIVAYIQHETMKFLTDTITSQCGNFKLELYDIRYDPVGQSKTLFCSESYLPNNKRAGLKRKLLEESGYIL